MNYRQTYLKIDREAIRHNIEAVKAATGKQLIGVIKANGYGVGDLEMAKLLIEGGAVILAVSSLDEALHLRENGITADILVLGYVAAEHIKVAIANNIILSVTSLDWVKDLKKQDPEGLRVHMKIDTKINRFGITAIADFNEALALSFAMKVNIEGAYTQYADSEADDNVITARQYDLFKQYIEQAAFRFKFLHVSNSEACFHFKEDELTNAVRVGMALLGYIYHRDELRLAVSLYTRIAMIKRVAKGETVGYGCVYTCTQDELIATLPIGYADGLFRRNQNRYVLVNGCKAQIVGRVCMDNCMIRLERPAQVGDEVEIFGPHIPLMEMADELATTPCEILTLLSSRVPRIFY